ncbi:MAG: carboxymuconolactone decarboxylase family protein [Gemmatimonadaceae bacterium]
MIETRSEYTLDALDERTRQLVRTAAIISSGDETILRETLAIAARSVPVEWMEELIVQSYLFSGFPRALNAAREWRRVSPVAAPLVDEGDDVTHVDEWRARGEVTCAAVYGGMYDKLRVNIRHLHPALDAAMVVEGYGKILGRPGLDLPRRELCIVAACASTGQDRQLHSHLHGSLNVGVAPKALADAVDALLPVIGADRVRAVRLLLARVVGK